MAKEEIIVTGTKEGVVVNGSESTLQSKETTAETKVASDVVQNNEESGSNGLFGSGGFSMNLIIPYIIFLGALYYLMIRPQKKREKELVNMRASIATGDSVVTSSGLYGKVVDVLENTFVIEFGTNKGIRVPIKKSEVVGKELPN